MVREFARLYGPIIILLENLHELDTWSWQLLAKIAEVCVCARMRARARACLYVSVGGCMRVCVCARAHTCNTCARA